MAHFASLLAGMVIYAISPFKDTSSSNNSPGNEENNMYSSNREQNNSVLQDLDCAAISTTALAKQHGISSDFLLEYLLASDYVRRTDTSLELTERGVGIGGTYIEYENGKGVGWFESCLDEIIKSRRWPVAVKYKFSEIQKKVFRRLNSCGSERELLHRQIEGGRKILVSQEELDCYIWAFGRMHEKRMTEACRELHRRCDFTSSLADYRFDLVDYACGQGLASIAFSEYLKSLGMIHHIDALTLVEPGALALESGAEHFTGSVKKVNKHFDKLRAHDIKTSEEHIKFHLFSNILDMGGEHFDLEGLANTILTSQKGTNYFICVSPLEKDKLTDFMQCFEGHIEISSFSGEFPNPSAHAGSKPWKVVWNIFKVEL